MIYACSRNNKIKYSPVNTRYTLSKRVSRVYKVPVKMTKHKKNKHNQFKIICSSKVGINVVWLVMKISVDGAWSKWVPWTTCSTSCGHGTKTRSRTCSNPPPQNGGKICTGNNTETGKCIVRGCPGKKC